MSENVISPRECTNCRKDIDKQLDTQTHRLNVHSEEIADLKVISERLLVLIEQGHKPEKDPQVKESFWNTKAGRLIPWLVFTIIIIIVISLVGTNLIDAWKQVKDIIPTTKGG